ncbi:unnamed protein product, partial [Cuscuta europaea]
MGRETSYHENVKQRSKDSVSDRVGSSMAHSAKEGDMYNEYRESKSEKTDHRRDEKFSSSKDEVFVAKRSKFDIIDVETKSGIDDEKHYSSPKQGEVSSDQGVKDSDIDAAKVAAMKAAELVNKNLIGTGCLTADQKKKLLWGNKKSSYKSEESAHCWDTSTFGDLERQEKFNKLMSLRVYWWYLWGIVGSEGQYQRGAQTTRWGRPRSCCREAEGAAVADRLGETIYCRTSSKRWAYCWIRPLRICFERLIMRFIKITVTLVVSCMTFYFSSGFAGYKFYLNGCLMFPYGLGLQCIWKFINDLYRK